VKRFRGWLVFKAHRLVYHSTLGPRVKRKYAQELKETLVRIVKKQTGELHVVL
jgi:hypothetical protein